MSLGVFLVFCLSVIGYTFYNWISNYVMIDLDIISNIVVFKEQPIEIQMSPEASKEYKIKLNTYLEDRRNGLLKNCGDVCRTTQKESKGM